jgi:hypothetical protein
MCKKIFISVLIVAIFNLLVGCYSSEIITVPEYNRIEDKDKPDDIRLMTKDYKVYYFSESNFYVENDTVCGKGIFLPSEEPFEGNIAFSDVVSIEVENINWLNTSLLVLGILGILAIGAVGLFALAMSGMEH